MNDLQTLSPALISQQLPDWTICREGAAIRRIFKFRDFVEAFAFMTRLAFFSERAGHHPEWFNVYQTLDIVLTTHDAGGITQRDLDWAGVADRHFAEHLAGVALQARGAT